MIYVLLDQQLKLKWKLCIEQKKGKIRGADKDTASWQVFLAGYLVYN